MAHQRLPAPQGLWTPTPLPPRGQIRTDGKSFAIHLPADARDWAPWHQFTPGGGDQPPLTHVVVYRAPWRVLGSLLSLLHELPPAADEPAAGPAPAVYHRGDACPTHLAGVITADGTVWPREAWDTGLWPTWEELLDLGPLVAIPVLRLLEQSGVLSETGDC